MIHAGQVLNGRYKLLRPLGQGSQAYVWVAEHLALGSQVAVKLIDPELAKQQDARDRFAREATAAAKLRSAHVVHILDHGIEGDQPFIVMELLDGEDLFDRLERRRRLTLAETSRIITQVARALMRAHAEGIIHRDLKPENVFLVRNEDDELAKVLDFGVAKITTPAKQTMTRTGVGTLIGTPHYMSPEQVKGISEIDHRSDLWSLGVIAYQCVTGHLPFDSEGVGDLLIRITMSEPETPSKLNPELPAAFDDWFRKASAKEPEQRFQTARELADALSRVLGMSAAPMSQRVLVSLGDSPDLDWGSLAGVRIPMPPRGGGGVELTGLPPSTGRASSREPTLDAQDIVEVVEGSRPPPPPTLESEPPPSQGRPPAPASVRGSALAAPASDASPVLSPRPPIKTPASSPKLSGNPFLNDTTPSSSPRSPASGRGLQSTVTGLSSHASYAPPAEPENARRKRAIWFVGAGFVLASVLITVGVIRSNGGFSAMTKGGAAPPTHSSTVTATPVNSYPALNASASSSAEVVDPMAAKKPLPKATPTPFLPPPKPKKTEEAPVEIVIPDP
ncbi:MAG: protein kinase [Polyangiaceae bacterium]